MKILVSYQLTLPLHYLTLAKYNVKYYLLTIGLTMLFDKHENVIYSIWKLSFTGIKVEVVHWNP